jgi:hypothetical protein
LEIQKLPATPQQLQNLRALMLAKLDSYYGGGMIPDTHQYERIRQLPNAELEREFKQVFNVSATTYYFD